jgi:hypothetical protein
MPSQYSIDQPERAKQRTAPGGVQAPFFNSNPIGRSASFLQLQRAIGNRRVVELIRAKRLTPEGRIIGGGMVGGDMSRIQPKLTVGAPDDQYEQEADRVARQVMSMPDTAPATPLQRAGIPEEAPKEAEDKDKLLQASSLSVVGAAITPLARHSPFQRQPEEEPEEPEKEATLQRSHIANAANSTNAEGALQRQPEVEEDEAQQVQPAQTVQAKSSASLTESFEAGEEVESRLNRSKGGGSPLPEAVRTFMEPRFGTDFNQVRVHTGSDAIQMNRDVGAQAFTHGADIYYGDGHSPGDLDLTAHELTHVVQQTGGSPLQTKRLPALDKARPAPTAPTRAEQSPMQRACSTCGAGKEDKEKISTKPLDHALFDSSRIQRKTDRGVDGSDYVELTIPDGTYVLEAANIPAEAYWELTYTNYADVYATASQFLPRVIDGLNADPHTLRHTDKGIKPEHKFKIKPGVDLEPEAGWGSAKVQGFRHGYISDDPVVEAYLQFDTVPLLENPGAEEFVANNVIDMNPDHHEAFSCPEQGKMQLQKETSISVSDGIAVSETKTVGNTLGFEVTGKIGKKDSWEIGGKAGYQRTWGKSLGKTVTEQKSVTKKLQVNYTCEGPGDWAFVPTCSVWRTPLTVNVSDKTGKRTGQDKAYVYRVKYNPDARVCKVVNGKVDPACGKTSATETTAAAAGSKPVLDMSPDEFEKNQEAQYQLFTMAKSCRARMQALAEEILNQQLITGGEAKSILKRDSLPEFVKGVVAKCRRNGYTRIGQMDDIVRGRFDLRSNEDVNTVAAALKGQKKYPVAFAVAPQRPQPGGGFGYPRWHIIISDPESGLTHEWQIGTKAVTEVFEKGNIRLPAGVELGPGMKPNLHDIEYDIFKGIEKKYPDVHKRHNLPEFHAKVDTLAAEAGLKGEKTPDLTKKINALHEDAYLHLQKLVDEFGPEWLKQFYH